jgi:hypothetical protein
MKETLAALLLILAESAALMTPANAEPVSLWRVQEIDFQSERSYQHPFREVRLEVTFTSPSGNHPTVDAFWDGGGVWRVRFSPNETGSWKWRSTCRPADDANLHDQEGSFECTGIDASETPSLAGPLRLSANRRYLVNPDGSPFFWLADTAWNGVLRAKDDDWSRYLATRKKQGFTAIQFVNTQWRGGNKILPAPVYLGEKDVSVNVDYLQAMDRRVAEINRQGLVAVPVLLWALNETDPGRALQVEDAIRLARYFVARWGGYNVVWFLGGDGRYQEVERWKQIGREVFPGRKDDDPMKRLCTLHPSGGNWIVPNFGGEPWLDFVGYQSSHGNRPKDLQWLTSGPAAANWNKEPIRPIINLEPNYELIPGHPEMIPHSPQHVRRAAYWSMLVTPPAGVSYGHHAVWPWNDRLGEIEGHAGIGKADAWHTGLETEGIAGMTILHRFFASGQWTELRPLPTLLANQPGEKHPGKFVAAAQSKDRTWTVVYLPVGGVIQLKADELPKKWQAYWTDPRTGKSQTANALELRFTAPDQNDWLLEIKG